MPLKIGIGIGVVEGGVIGGGGAVLPPTLVSLNVSTGSTLGGTGVVGTGTNLTGATAVTVGGAAATGVSSTSSTVNFITPAGSAGAATVIVTCTAGTATLTNGFTYAVPAPTVVSLDKPYSQATGGVVRVATGTALGSVTGVTVGGTNATSISSTPTTVTFTTPSGTAGPADVVVTTAAGSFTLTGGITYYSVIALVGTQPVIGGTSTATTAAADMSLASMLAAALGYSNGATVTVSDSSSNTWVKRTAQNSTFDRSQVAYAANPTVTAAQTATMAGANMFGAIAFAGFSGVATASPYDTEATGAARCRLATVSPQGRSRRRIPARSLWSHAKSRKRRLRPRPSTQGSRFAPYWRVTMARASTAS